MHRRIRNEQFKWKTAEIKLLILYDNVGKTLSVYFHQNLDITEGNTPFDSAIRASFHSKKTYSRNRLGHIRVPKTLTFKTGLSAEPFM